MIAPFPSDAGTAMSALLSLLVLVAAAPLVPGVATRTRAILTGRRGPPVWQLYADLRKLVGKGAVYSVTTTAAFRLAPIVVCATTVLAAAIVPADGRSSLIAFPGDAVAFAYVLALGRFLLVLGALDTGSSFEGMGASREVTFATFVEPGLFVVLVALAVASGQVSLRDMLGQALWQHWPAVAPALVLLAASAFVLMLAECARVPVDDPATHLELTMIHEVMILDHSGPDLGLMLYASALKLAVFATLLIDLVIPRGALPPWASAAVLLVGLVGVGVAIGIVESSIARLRLPRVTLYIASGSVLASSALILLLR